MYYIFFDHNLVCPICLFLLPIYGLLFYIRLGIVINLKEEGQDIFPFQNFSSYTNTFSLYSTLAFRYSNVVGIGPFN